MKTTAIPEEAFNSGLLNREYHDRLLMDLERLCAKAGVPTSAILLRLSDFCKKGQDYDWVRDFKISPDAGLAYVGKSDVPAADKMTAIVGACLRNYTDARMMVLQDVLAKLKDGAMDSPTLLLIPNFYLGKDDGGDVATWETTRLLDLLLARQSEGKKTVIFAASLAGVEKAYGSSVRELIEGKYSIAGSEFIPAHALAQ